jgi:SAM-dependent methyltransferase
MIDGRGARDYDRVGTPIFGRLDRRLVELAAVRAGDHVLDVATGRGAVLFTAAELAGERGRVIGVDLAEEMVARTSTDIRARGITNAEVRVADAERLSEFVDGELDCVTCALAIYWRFAGLFALSALASAAALVAMAPNLPITTLGCAGAVSGVIGAHPCADGAHPADAGSSFRRSRSWAPGSPFRSPSHTPTRLSRWPVPAATSHTAPAAGLIVGLLALIRSRPRAAHVCSAPHGRRARA